MMTKKQKIIEKVKHLKYKCFFYKGNGVMHYIGKKYVFTGDIDELYNEIMKQSNEL